MPITFVVPGKPVPQPRTSTARNGHRFTPDNGIKGYRAHVAMMARRAGCKPAPITDPVAITIRIFFARPKSHFTAKGQLKSSAPRFPSKRLGDSDNIGKGVKDCLISIAYDDDSQVVEDHYFKSWGPEDRTEITIL